MPSAVLVLQFVTGKYAEQEFALQPDTAYIAGRSSEVDLVLADDAVSRKHARFFSNRGHLWIRDLGSRNGTKINGRSVDRAPLRDGDRLTIGSSLIKIAKMEMSQVSGTWRGKKRRGAEEESASAGRSMSGSIEDIPLADVLQWLATSRKTGQLKVRSPADGLSGSLHLREGQVFYATLEGSAKVPPQKALMRMLLWDKGMFELDSNIIEEVDEEIEVPLEHLLMEAARQQDELAALSARTPLPEHTAPVRIEAASSVRWKDLDPEELDLLQDIHEGETWGAVLDLTDRDDLGVTKAAVALSKKGIISWSS
jgi:hypothetical protein